MKTMRSAAAVLLTVFATHAFAANESPTVPELLRFADGTEVRSVADWEGRRRGEILDFYLREIYGVRPVDRPDGLVFEPVGPDTEAMGGRAIRKRIRVGFDTPSGRYGFVFTAFIPKRNVEQGVASPAFLLICNRDPSENIDPERVRKSYFWPAEEIIDRGYATIAFFNGDLAPDDGVKAFTEGVIAAYGKRGENGWGVLSAWAWGASRVMDWIVTEPTLDAHHVAVVGHSRGGKTALLAGVTDPRFAMACSNDSGCGGAKLNHMNLPRSEHFADLAERFPYWFSPRFPRWIGRESEMPFDQHEWIALMAPRLVAIASASEDFWAGPDGELEAARLASPAWELYGKKGLADDGCISYHLRTGSHTLSTYDWHKYLDFADRHGFRSRSID